MQYGPDSGWLYGLASNPLRDLCATLGNDVPTLHRDDQAGGNPRKGGLHLLGLRPPEAAPRGRVVLRVRDASGDLSYAREHPRRSYARARTTLQQPRAPRLAARTGPFASWPDFQPSSGIDTSSSLPCREGSHSAPRWTLPFIFVGRSRSGCPMRTLSIPRNSKTTGSLSRRASLPLRHPQGCTRGFHRLIANPRRAREDRENSLPPCDLQLSLAAKSAYALAARVRASLLQPMRPFHGCASHSSCRRSPAADSPRTCLAAAALARIMLLVRWPCPAALCAVRAQAAPSPHPPGEQCSQTAHQAAHSHELAVQPVVR